MLLWLTFGTGLLDAASYLKLGHVFVANMTGNVVFLGFATAGARDVSFSASLMAVVAFLGGALLGGRLGVRFGGHRGQLLYVAGAVKVVLVAAACGVAAYYDGRINGGEQAVVITLLAVTMGVQNATARRIGVPDLTTTVLTLTLTGLAADSRWGGGNSPRWRPRTLAVCAMLAGAVAGGLLALYVSIAAALAAATLLLLRNVVVARRLASSSEPWTHPV